MPADRATRRPCRGPIEVQMEAELEGIRFELIRADLFRIRELHMDTSNAIVADIIYNLDEHLRTHFATFSWPVVLNDRVLEICHSIWTLTKFVELTLEYIPQKRVGFFRRIGNYIQAVVFNGLRNAYGLERL